MRMLCKPTQVLEYAYMQPTNTYTIHSRNKPHPFTPSALHWSSAESSMFLMGTSKVRMSRLSGPWAFSRILSILSCSVSAALYSLWSLLFCSTQ